MKYFVTCLNFDLFCSCSVVGIGVCFEDHGKSRLAEFIDGTWARLKWYVLTVMLSFSQVSDWAIVSLNCLEVYWAQPIISLPEEFHFWTRHTQRCYLLSNWLVPNFFELLCIAGPKTKILWQQTDLRFYLHFAILFFYFSFILSFVLRLQPNYTYFRNFLSIIFWFETRRKEKKEKYITCLERLPKTVTDALAPHQQQITIGG